MSRYTPAELDDFALRDLRSDAEQSERQAAEGAPFFPERGITAVSLSAYAAKCRERIARYANGGAHGAVLGGVR